MATFVNLERRGIRMSSINIWAERYRLDLVRGLVDRHGSGKAKTRRAIALISSHPSLLLVPQPACTLTLSC
jgi:hypothetical protein